ncbi:MAG: hypothetical protein PGN08_09140 [Sphingomonas taxi]
MAQAQRNEIDPHGQPLSWQGRADSAPPAGQPASPIARLQADLARRLMQNEAADERPHPVSPTERLVQGLSTAGGYVGLACGYGVAGLAITYWLWR